MQFGGDGCGDWLPGQLECRRCRVPALRDLSSSTCGYWPSPLPSSESSSSPYRPLLLILAAGKTASSLGSLAFFLIQEEVFIYLLNFLVDGYLALMALWLWALAGRVGRPAAPG